MTVVDFDDHVTPAELPPSPHRLPTPPERVVSPPVKPNLFAIIKDALTKDITRMTIPVHFNEPLSFLQRLAEDVEYHSLLDVAAHPRYARTPHRAALVAAFVISQYSSTSARTSKPFNPLLGETFELVLPQRGLVLVAEQVSHHPPVSALFTKGNGWTYHTAHRVRNKFLVNAMEAWPEGAVHICFDDGDHFVYEKPHTFVNNLFFGNMWIDSAGAVTIRNRHFIASLHMKRACTVPFREGKGLGNTVGSVFSAMDKSKKPLCNIVGNWTSHVLVDGKEVWKVSPKPPSSYTASSSLTAWAWSLNAPPHPPSVSLPSTDSRHRPDQRALESGNHRLASSEKARLEEAQRERRQTMEREGKHFQPRWFESYHDPDTGRKQWRYTGQYFRRKSDAIETWPHQSPHLF
ncbi:unnamed protein product [Agarophyton chilense]|eukprot:gb/GEZJ01001839.1/.p1 GENE.gb/GEZJ01001839.1/~~gb/GEZJ01001839.1/.p1  ORF type:complete len:405 (-),score=54.53 gb/GEZJ01001839.1/:609-1823(-)